MVIGIAGLLRMAELKDMQFNQVNLIKDATTGIEMFKIDVERAKQPGTARLTSFFIVAPLHVECLKDYMGTFDKKVCPSHSCPRANARAHDLLRFHFSGSYGSSLSKTQ
jgi:hypothetical protein